MFGIEKDIQDIMEVIYGPLGKKEEEECDKMAKQLVDNAVKEVKEMTETHDLRNQWYDEPVRYETPMTENEEEIEKVKAQIKVLEKKLSFLEELERTKSPVEEAYKRVYGVYPMTDLGDGCWENFQAGYKSAQKDYKVGEWEPTPQTPEKDKDPVSLYKRFENEGAYGQLYFDDALKVVKEFLMDEGFIEDENDEYITFTLQKSLLEVPND